MAELSENVGFLWSGFSREEQLFHHGIVCLAPLRRKPLISKSESVVAIVPVFNRCHFGVLQQGMHRELGRCPHGWLSRSQPVLNTFLNRVTLAHAAKN